MYDDSLCGGLDPFLYKIGGNPGLAAAEQLSVRSMI